MEALFRFRDLIKEIDILFLRCKEGVFFIEPNKVEEYFENRLSYINISRLNIVKVKYKNYDLYFFQRSLKECQTNFGALRVAVQHWAGSIAEPSIRGWSF